MEILLYTLMKMRVIIRFHTEAPEAALYDDFGKRLRCLRKARKLRQLDSVYDFFRPEADHTPTF
jgi:hypothetical protein